MNRRSKNVLSMQALNTSVWVTVERYLDPVLAARMLDKAGTWSAVKHMLSQRMQTTFTRPLTGSGLRILGGECTDTAWRGYGKQDLGESLEGCSSR